MSGKGEKQMADVIIIAVIGSALAGVVWKKVRNHKEGKSGCGCGCSGCSLKGTCQKETVWQIKFYGTVCIIIDRKCGGIRGGLRSRSHTSGLHRFYIKKSNCLPQAGIHILLAVKGIWIISQDFGQWQNSHKKCTKRFTFWHIVQSSRNNFILL